MENYKWPTWNLKADSMTEHNAIQSSWHYPLQNQATCQSNWQLQELKKRWQNLDRRRYPKEYGKHTRLYHTSQSHSTNHPATTLLPSPCSHNQSRTISSSIQRCQGENILICIWQAHWALQSCYWMPNPLCTASNNDDNPVPNRPLPMLLANGSWHHARKRIRHS